MTVEKNEVDETLLDELQNDIFELMSTDSFSRFLKSDIYVNYTKDKHPDWY